MYKMLVVSPEFDGVNKVKQSRLVNTVSASLLPPSHS
jgi:stress-induced morphogen